MENKMSTSKIVVYVQKTKQMMDNNENKFKKTDRPRLRVVLPDNKTKWMYADELSAFIINNFKIIDDREK